MQGNSVGPLGCERLMRALLANGSLLTLRMGANPLGPEGAQRLG